MSTEKRECPPFHRPPTAAAQIEEWDEEKAAKKTTPPPTDDPTPLPSDLVAAGDALLHALRSTQEQSGCECGDFGPCRRCTAASIEAADASQAWAEAKKEASV